MSVNLDTRETPQRQVTQQEREATGRNVAAILQYARDNPRLTAWEEGFLASLAQMLWRYKGRLMLSEKQAMVLLRIQDKVMDTLMPPGSGDGTEAEEPDAPLEN